MALTGSPIVSDTAVGRWVVSLASGQAIRHAVEWARVLALLLRMEVERVRVRGSGVV